MDQSSNSGFAGARMLAKHTILSNPKMVAGILAVTVVLLLVFMALYFRCRKASKAGMSSSNSTGGNLPVWQNGSQHAGDRTPSAAGFFTDMSAGQHELDSALVTAQLGSLCGPASAVSLEEAQAAVMMGSITPEMLYARA